MIIFGIIYEDTPLWDALGEKFAFYFRGFIWYFMIIFFFVTLF